MTDLIAQLPASIVGHLLGLDPSTADKWINEAGAPRAGYAAEVSRRDGLSPDGHLTTNLYHREIRGICGRSGRNFNGDRL
jgi:hypothetical protein